MPANVCTSIDNFNFVRRSAPPMLLEELFYKVIARSHATQSEQPEEGEMILRRLRDLEKRAQSENDAADGSGEGGIQNATSSAFESK